MWYVAIQYQKGLYLQKTITIRESFLMDYKKLTIRKVFLLRIIPNIQYTYVKNFALGWSKQKKVFYIGHIDATVLYTCRTAKCCITTKCFILGQLQNTSDTWQCARQANNLLRTSHLLKTPNKFYIEARLKRPHPQIIF